jgi:hypothetical protein
VKKSLIILTLFFIINLPAQTKKEKTDLSKFIIGTWHTVENQLTTSYLTMEFKKDNEFVYILRSLWRASYRLTKDNQLITSAIMPGIKKIIKDTSIVDIKKDTLTMIITKNKIPESYAFYRRENKGTKESGLAGEWYCQNYTGYPTDLTITKDGEYKLSQVLKAFKGIYSVKGDHFIVHSGTTTMMNMKFQKFNDDMIIYGDGPNMRMKRVR